MSAPGLPCLHLHLDGSLRPSTVCELAEALGLDVPADLPFQPGMGLSAALARFAFTLRLLQTPAAVRRVASEIVDDAVADGVTTLEVRFAPQLHGGPLEDIVDAALDGLDGRAGLILCALYGEDPAVAEALVDVARDRPRVVGLDLAGGPTPGARFGLADHARAFARAEQIGLGRTVHAGEGRPPAEIAAAIHLLRANRIGHGTTVLDDPAVLDLVLTNNVTIEACLTSNWHVGAIPSIGAHPLAQWLSLGVRVCVNPDNTLLSAVSASEEHKRAEALVGAQGIAAVVGHGHAAAFVR